MLTISPKYPDTGRSRVVIENVRPSCDAGRFPVKRIMGDLVEVNAHVFCDSHDVVAAVVRVQHQDSQDWLEYPLQDHPNDEWSGCFPASELGVYRFHIVAWADEFLTWRRDLVKRIEADQQIDVDLEIGARIIDRAADRARLSTEQQELARWAGRIRTEPTAALGNQLSVDKPLHQMMMRNADRSNATTSNSDYEIVVDRKKAEFSSWYELFPRSCSKVPGKHGTLRDVIDYLPYVSSLGFDVLYLPPIHPIGTAHRKGRNNATACLPGDVGSPWAIGNKQGGHKSIHPDLGTLEDFRALVRAAADADIELALDIAFQCSPDHPYVVEHPEWFKAQPDGTIQYAENPPKKYQDIYPFNFECDEWQQLWNELKSIFEFWIDEGVKIFRVDNPHTKPFGFWEWCITELRKQNPEVLLLAEAFTRPKIMKRLGKLGFSQSYTYFTWRNFKREIIEYMEELTGEESANIYRPNFWPNTPDILHETLQNGGQSTFQMRVILAGTLCGNYGIYGPAYELCENAPAKAGSEEYLDSEKYEIRQRNIAAEHSIADTIRQLNSIRKQHPALQTNASLVFHETDNEQLICYSKSASLNDDVILVVVNLDAENKQWGHATVDLHKIGRQNIQTFEVRDLLSNETYTWNSGQNFIELGPHRQPAHIFLVR